MAVKRRYAGHLQVDADAQKELRRVLKMWKSPSLRTSEGSVFTGGQARCVGGALPLRGSESP